MRKHSIESIWVAALEYKGEASTRAHTACDSRNHSTQADALNPTRDDFQNKSRTT